MGAIGPAGRRCREGRDDTGTIASSSTALPVSTEVRPTLLAILNRRCTDGRLRSESISSTRAPFSANTIDSSVVIDVLPSEGLALLIRMTWGGVPAGGRRMGGGRDGGAPPR